MSQASQPGAAAAAAPVIAPTAPSAPPAPDSSPGSAVAGRPAATDRAGRTMDTPRRLRLLSLAVMITGIVVGVVGALVFSFLAYSLYRAESDTAQLIRVQQIQTNLLTADATATNAFLVGGLEPPAQRAAYDQALSTTGSLITDAAQAQPADAEALAAVNQQVVSYAAAIEQARANNRQNLPVGSQYLRSASSELRTETLPDPGQPGQHQRRPGHRPDEGVGRLGLRGRGPAGSGGRGHRPGLAGPPVPSHHQCRHAGQFGGPAARADRRNDRRAAVEQRGPHHPGRQLRLGERRRRRADRRQQRQVQREPDPDRPRLGGGLPDGMAVVVRRCAGQSGPPRRPTDRAVAELRRGAQRDSEAG